MIRENRQLTYEENVEQFESLLDLYLTDPSVVGKPRPTGEGMNDDELDDALLKVAIVKAAGGDVQKAIDDAWVLFNDEFPTGH